MNAKPREAALPSPEGMIQPNLGKVEGPKRVDARFVINTVVEAETPREKDKERRQLVEINESAAGKLQEAQLTREGERVSKTLFNEIAADIKRENPNVDTSYLLQRVARLREDIMQELLAPQQSLLGVGVKMLDTRRIKGHELELIRKDIAERAKAIETEVLDIETQETGISPLRRIRKALRFREMRKREVELAQRENLSEKVKQVAVKQLLAEEAQYVLDQVEGWAVLEHIEKQFGSKGLVEFNSETKRWRYTDEGRADAKELYDWMVEQAKPEPGEEAAFPFADSMRIQIARLRRAAEIGKGRNLQLAGFAEHGARSAGQRLALTEVRATEAEGGENSSSPWQRVVEQRKAEAEAQGKKVLPDEFYMAQIAPKVLKLRESLAEAVEMRIWDEKKKLAYSPFDIKTAIRTAEEYVVEKAEDPAKALGKFYESRRAEDFVVRVLEKGLPEVASISVADIAEAAEGILLEDGEVGKIMGRVKELVAKNLLKPETFIKLAKGARYANVLASLFVPVAPVVLAKLGELDLGDMVGDVGELVDHMLQEIGEGGHEIAEHIHNFSVVSVAEAAEIEEIDVGHFCKQLERVGNIPEECVEHALAVDFGVESEAPKEKENVLVHAAPLAEHWLREDKGIGSEEAERKSPPPPEQHEATLPAVGTGTEPTVEAEMIDVQDITEQDVGEVGPEVPEVGQEEETGKAVAEDIEQIKKMQKAEAKEKAMAELPNKLRKVVEEDHLNLRVGDVEIFPQEARDICIKSALASAIEAVGGDIGDFDHFIEEIDFNHLLNMEPGESVSLEDEGVDVVKANIAQANDLWKRSIRGEKIKSTEYKDAIQAVVDYYTDVLERENMATFSAGDISNLSHDGAVTGVETFLDTAGNLREVRIIVTDGNMGWSASQEEGNGFEDLKEMGGESVDGIPYITYTLKLSQLSDASLDKLNSVLDDIAEGTKTMESLRPEDRENLKIVNFFSNFQSLKILKVQRLNSKTN